MTYKTQTTGLFEVAVEEVVACPGLGSILALIAMLLLRGSADAGVREWCMMYVKQGESQGGECGWQVDVEARTTQLQYWTLQQHMFTIIGAWSFGPGFSTVKASVD